MLFGSFLCRPRQRITCQLIELLGDEWLLVPAYHYRWAYGGDGSSRQGYTQYEDSGTVTVGRYQSSGAKTGTLDIKF